MSIKHLFIHENYYKTYKPFICVISSPKIYCNYNKQNLFQNILIYCTKIHSEMKCSFEKYIETQFI